MKDVLGNDLLPGNTVAVGSSWNGRIDIITVHEDALNPKYKKLKVVYSNGEVSYLDKVQFRFLNLTTYVTKNYANKDVVGNFWMK